MPSLRELLDLVIDIANHRGETFSDDFAVVVERQVRQRWPGERVYVMPAGSRKDPARAERIAAAARLLPTGVVSERLGVSRQLVAYHTNRQKPVR